VVEGWVDTGDFSHPDRLAPDVGGIQAPDVAPDALSQLPFCLLADALARRELIADVRDSHGYAECAEWLADERLAPALRELLPTTEEVLREEEARRRAREEARKREEEARKREEEARRRATGRSGQMGALRLAVVNYNVLRIMSGLGGIHYSD
jgi:hypothetical protein